MRYGTIVYDNLVLGQYQFSIEEDDKLITDRLGELENYIVSQWREGIVLTLKVIDEQLYDTSYILLFPDGSEQKMSYSAQDFFSITPYKKTRQGRFSYLLDFCKGLSHNGIQSYEEWDEEGKEFIGNIIINGKSLFYSGKTVKETEENFRKITACNH